MGLQLGFVALLLLLIVLAGATFRILREYERGVVFQLGRFWQVKGPGLILLIPVIQQMVRVDLRTVVLDVPTQDVITRDNVSVKVNAVLYFRVLDPQKAIIQVEDFLMATSQLAQTTLRAVLGKHELDELLAERERLNVDIQQVLDAQTDAWGDQGRQRRDQACGPQRIDDPRHRQTGRSGTRTPGQSDPRRRRTASLGKTHASR